MAVIQRPFRADHVGSLLRPERLKQARQDYQNNIIDAQALKQVEDEEIEHIIENNLKLDYIVSLMESFAEVGGISIS